MVMSLDLIDEVLDSKLRKSLRGQEICEGWIVIMLGVKEYKTMKLVHPPHCVCFNLENVKSPCGSLRREQCLSVTNTAFLFKSCLALSFKKVVSPKTRVKSGFKKLELNLNFIRSI